MAALEKKKKETRPVGPAAPAPRAVESPAWALLIALASIAGLWSLFLWMELVLLRSGGSTFCATEGSFDCSSVWNGSFASKIQGLTRLPVAAWGLVWSTVAFSLALAGLSRSARSRSIGRVFAAVRITAIAGAAGVVVMIAASIAAGAVCLGCLAMDALIAAYAVVALRRWRPFGLPDWPRAAALAAGCAVAAFVVLLYPGLKTPRSMAEAGRRAVAAAAKSASGSEVSAEPADAAPANPQRDKAIADMIATLEPALKQTLADSLAIYRASTPQQLPAPRSLVGPEMSPVRVTDFTDILCEHCASLNETLRSLRREVPPGSYSVDSRQFPLDGRCNPLLQPGGNRDDVRCVAAKLRICVEPSGKEPELATALFEKQEGLTRSQAIDIASRFLSRGQIDSCLDSPEVKQTLEQDIAMASQFDSDGTPIVAINGRKGTSFAPFLYAIILNRGKPDNPSFAALPPGNPNAHLH